MFDQVTRHHGWRGVSLVRSLIRLAVAALALILGAGGGLATSYFFRPSDAEIRSAVRTLVPSGVTVVGEGHGKQGGSIVTVFQPYIAVLEISGGPADAEERVDLFRQQAVASGWREASSERSQNSVHLEYVRNGLRGGTALILNHPVTFLETTRDAGATTRRRVIGASIGAVAGLLVGLGLLSVRRRSAQRR